MRHTLPGPAPSRPSARTEPTARPADQPRKEPPEGEAKQDMNKRFGPTAFLVVAVAAAAFLLAATANAPAGTGLHWTSKAAPGYQHYYSSRGSPKEQSAICGKSSARVIRCVRILGLLDFTLSARLLSRTRVQYVFADRFGRRRLRVWTRRVPNRDWVG
jgi:hypothetical protein